MNVRLRKPTVHCTIHTICVKDISASFYSYVADWCVCMNIWFASFCRFFFAARWALSFCLYRFLPDGFFFILLCMLLLWSVFVKTTTRFSTCKTKFYRIFDVCNSVLCRWILVHDCVCIEICKWSAFSKCVLCPSSTKPIFFWPCSHITQKTNDRRSGHQHIHMHTHIRYTKDYTYV